MTQPRRRRCLIQLLLVVGILSAGDLWAKQYTGYLRKTYADRPSTPAVGFQVNICAQGYMPPYCIGGGGGSAVTDSNGFFRIYMNPNWYVEYDLYAWNDAELWGSQYASEFAVGLYTPPIDFNDVFLGTIYTSPRPLAPQATYPANNGYAYSAPCTTTFTWTDGLDSQRRSSRWPINYQVTVIRPSGAATTYPIVGTPSMPLQLQSLSGIWRWYVVARLRVAFFGPSPIYFTTTSPTFSFWMPTTRPADCSSTFDDAAFVSQAPPPSQVNLGDTSSVSVTMKNIGTTSWKGPEMVRLGSQNPQDNQTWGISRVILAPNEVVAPGQEKKFTFDATSPSTAGTYNFQWQMVRDTGPYWFGARTTNVTVKVAERQALPPQIDPLCCATKRGPTSGGTTVVITGANFVSGAAVSFGGLRSGNVTVDNGSQITAVTPRHAAGVVDIAVTNPDGQGDRLPNAFTYALPVISSISPNGGPMAGGTEVTITGTDFASGVSVLIGEVAARSVTVVNSTQITATTPAHACGSTDVVVKNPDNQSAILPGGFYYTSPQPPGGLTPNGTMFPRTTTSVTLTWAATPGATQYAVRVRDNTDGTLRDSRNNCPTNTIYLCVNGLVGTSYTVAVQAGHSYDWWLHAGSSCGQYSLQTNASFSVTGNPPTPTGISPGTGPMAGGTAVTITGADFRSGAKVTIGGVAATGVTVVSAAQMTATTPAHACGTVDVVVTNSDGQRGTLSGGFSYTSPQPPTGLTPNGTTLPSTTTSVTLTWAATPGATQYAVRVRDNTDGTLRDPRNNCPTNTIYLCVNGVVGTSYTVAVQAGHSYDWWLHSGSSCSQYSLQTNASFSVAAPAPAPTVTSISPGNGPMAGGTAVTILGTGFQSGATLAIGGVAATGVAVVSSTQITATTGAHACGTVDVVVKNPDNKTGTLAGAFSYTSPQPPTGLTPNGTTLPSTTTSVTLTWAATPGATQYAVRIRDNTDGTLRDPRNNCPTNTLYLCVNGVVGTSYTVAVQAGHGYDWWLHSGSSCGQYSLQTNASFSVAAAVPPPPPTGLSPDGTTLAAGTTTVTMSWAATAGATKYAVRLQDNTDGTIRDPRNNCPVNTIYLCVNDIPSTSYSAPVTSGHSYTWWVHAGNSFGYSSPTYATFSVAAAVPPPPPTGLNPDSATLASGTTTVTLSWAATPGATKYAVRLQDNTDGTIRDPRNNCPVNTIYLCVNDIPSTSYSAPVTSGHSYTWWVHAGNSFGYSSPTYASFSVAVEPLHAPTGLYKDPPSRNLVWTPPNNLTGADAVTYDLWIYGGVTCGGGCLYHPGAPSWYTMGAEIGPGTYTWTLKANSVSRPSSGAVAGPAFSMP